MICHVMPCAIPYHTIPYHTMPCHETRCLACGLHLRCNFWALLGFALTAARFFFFFFALRTWQGVNFGNDAALLVVEMFINTRGVGLAEAFAKTCKETYGLPPNRRYVIHCFVPCCCVPGMFLFCYGVFRIFLFLFVYVCVFFSFLCFPVFCNSCVSCIFCCGFCASRFSCVFFCVFSRGVLCVGVLLCCVFLCVFVFLFLRHS